MFAKLQARYAHSQAATLAQDALQLELSEMRLDTTWKKGCVAFLIAFKNRVMDLENLRDQDNPITDHERRTWLSRSLLMHSEMNRAFGNLESNEILLASALPSVTGSPPASKLPFSELYEYMLDQAHKIDAAVRQTSKESRRIHEAETTARGRGRGRGAGRGTGRGRGRGSIPYIDPEKWATMTYEERAEHNKMRLAAYEANQAKTQSKTSKEDVDTQKEQEKETKEVDHVPTEVMSVVTTPTTPAPPGSVIRSILSSNSKKKQQTESVTTPDGRIFTRECNNMKLKYQIRNYEMERQIQAL